MSDLVQVENLSRYYDQHCAVADVSFSLAKGEVLGFLGPNGAGKTTTMQMLCGNLAPSSGRISINGIDLLEQPNKAKLSLGYLPDTPPLYKELTVDEFLSYCAELHCIPKVERHSALETAKDRCGLGSVADRLIANLSKGFQQRIGIAQAILHNPAVIVLDEPTVGLDPLQIREIRHLIRELGQDHGIILSTHILSEVQESCTHVQIIRQGQLILKSSITELNHRMQAKVLQVLTVRPGSADLLAEIPGVQRVETLGPCEFRLDIVDQHVTEIVAAKVVQSGWGLQVLAPQQHSLEEEFIRLTQSTLCNDC